MNDKGSVVADPPAERLAAVRAAAERVVPLALELTERVALVPAPTGEEAARSRLVAGLFAEAGLASEVDALGDVVARLPGEPPGDSRDGRGRPAVLLAGHLDTVFVAGTRLEVRRDEGRLHGPGIGDNSLGVGAVLALPALLAAAGVRPATDLLLVANVGEEGLGDLRGIRAVMDARPEVGAVVAVEGHNLGRVTHVAVGSRRLRLTARGPGGHSWGDAGRPSAIHVLARLIADLDALPLPRSPKTTLNVGMIDGGVSVNSIAPSASCLVDLRSTDETSLRRLVDRVERAVSAAGRNGTTVTSETIGDRPAGVLAADDPAVGIATGTLRALGVAVTYDASSTDANIPISRGVPAVCVGLTTGGNVHREDEYIDLAPVATGLAQLALLALGLADALAAGALRRPAGHGVARR